MRFNLIVISYLQAFLEKSETQDFARQERWKGIGWGQLVLEPVLVSFLVEESLMQSHIGFRYTTLYYAVLTTTTATISPQITLSDNTITVPWTLFPVLYWSFFNVGYLINHQFYLGE